MSRDELKDLNDRLQRVLHRYDVKAYQVQLDKELRQVIIKTDKFACEDMRVEIRAYVPEGLGILFQQIDQPLSDFIMPAEVPPKYVVDAIKEKLAANSVTHPSHYNSGKIEVIEAIEDWALNFHRGNAVKYTARAGKKDPSKEVEDLKKAVWYLEREIECLEAKKTTREKVRPNDMNKRG